MTFPDWGYFGERGKDAMALTDTEIRRAETKGKAYSVSDGAVCTLWSPP